MRGLPKTPVEASRLRLSMTLLFCSVTSATIGLAHPVFGQEKELHIRSIYYWTNCAESEVSDDRVRYSTDLSEVSTGRAQVSIPRTHRVGRYDRPLRSVAEDPSRHIVIQSLERQAQDDWCTSINADLKVSETEEILFVIHGFNLTFDEAVYRAAQFAQDSKFDGVVVVYCWPSVGKMDLNSYQIDQTRAALSTKSLIDLLSVAESEFRFAERHVLAHSLGCRLFAHSIANMPRRTEEELFGKVILAAPDIDSHVFENMLHAEVVQRAKDLFVYVTPKDRLLELSAQQHGERARAGSHGLSAIGDDKTQIIDVTSMLTISSAVRMNHLYFVDNPNVLNHIESVLSK